MNDIGNFETLGGSHIIEEEDERSQRRIRK